MLHAAKRSCAGASRRRRPQLAAAVAVAKARGLAWLVNLQSELASLERLRCGATIPGPRCMCCAAPMPTKWRRT